MVSKVYSEVICQQRPRGGEAHALEAGDCRKSSPGRMDGAHKGAEAGVWLLHLRNSKEAARPRTQLKGNGMGTREDVREENGKKRDTERCRG